MVAGTAALASPNRIVRQHTERRDRPMTGTRPATAERDRNAGHADREHEQRAGFTGSGPRSRRSVVADDLPVHRDDAGDGEATRRARRRSPTGCNDLSAFELALRTHVTARPYRIDSEPGRIGPADDGRVSRRRTPLGDRRSARGAPKSPLGKRIVGMSDPDPRSLRRSARQGTDHHRIRQPGQHRPATAGATASQSSTAAARALDATKVYGRGESRGASPRRSHRRLRAPAASPRSWGRRARASRR